MLQDDTAQTSSLYKLIEEVVQRQGQVDTSDRPGTVVGDIPSPTPKSRKATNKLDVHLKVCILTLVGGGLLTPHGLGGRKATRIVNA